ncbi:hypothetical protein ACFE04_017758 [Oxalis oulophora]
MWKSLAKLHQHQSLLLMNAVASIASNSTKATISFSTAGMSFHVHDKNLLVFAVLCLYSSGLQAFPGRKSQSIRIDFSSFHRLLQSVTREDEISFALMKETPENDWELMLIFRNTGTGRIRTDTIPSSTVSRPNEVEESQYSLFTKIPSQEFRQIFRFLGISVGSCVAENGDELYFYISEEKLKFSICRIPPVWLSSEISKSREVILSIKPAECKVGNEINQPIVGICSLEHASTFLKAAYMSDFVCILGDSESEILMKYRIGELGDLIFYLFPIFLGQQ